MTPLAHGEGRVQQVRSAAGGGVTRFTALAASIWLGCALMGTCRLGVVALERAARPERLDAAMGPAVALVSSSDEALAAWERGARAAGLDAERVAAAALASLAPERFRVWLVIEPGSLGETEWMAVDHFALSGGGLVFASLAGGRGPEEFEREERALRRLFPGDRFELRREASGVLSPMGLSSLAAGMAGEPIALRGAGDYLATRSGGALVWGSDPRAGGALADLYHGAPVVWIGCPLDWIRDEQLALRLAENALLLAAREPLVDVVAARPDARARASIRAERAESRAGEFRLVASNRGVHPASEVTLRVWLPVGAERPALERGRWFARKPSVRYASGHTWMELVVRELEPGESAEYTLRF